MTWLECAIRSIDPAADWDGYPTGLRDRALLALLSAGITVAEIGRLCACHVHHVDAEAASSACVAEEGSRIIVQWRVGRRHVRVTLSDVAGAQVLAYLTATRTWGERVPLIQGPAGPLTVSGLHSIVHVYRHRFAAVRSA